jgi:glycosyltransferase involved in cell wall biosynthesis
LNILHVTGLPCAKKFGGFERWLAEIGHFSSKSGHNVYISYSEVIKPAPVYRLLEDSGLSIITLQDDSAIESFCLTNQIDIIHFHFGFEGYRPLYRKLKRNRIALYVHLHCENYYFTNTDWRKQPSLFLRITGHRIKTFWTANYFAQFFAVSHAVLQQYRAMYFWRKKKISLLRLGLPECDRTVSSENPIPVISCTAFHSPIKGVDVLLSALSILKSDGIDFHCLQIGGSGGEGTAALKQQCSSLGLDDYITWVGLTNDVYAYLSVSDIYCQPSRTEALSLGIAEAMQMHLPIVASKVGGIPELVHDGVNGYLVPPNTPEELAEKLKALICNKELRAQMGLSSKMLFDKLSFTNRASVEALFSHYAASQK